eukprot:symbB.v1.2.027773.t1/scaffold2874.1/size68342/5
MRPWTHLANASRRCTLQLTRARRLTDRQRHWRLLLSTQRLRHEVPWLAVGCVAAGLLVKSSTPSRCEKQNGEQNPRLYPKDLEQFLKPSELNPTPVTLPPPFPGLARQEIMGGLVAKQTPFTKVDKRSEASPGICVYSFLLSAHNLSSRRLLAIVFQKFCQASTFGEPGFHIIPMKVIVNISYCAKAEVKGCDSHDKRLSFAVKPSYTVKRLKQQVMLVESVPFPEQVLELNGMVLADSQRIEDLAVTEGQELDLKVTATTAVFTQQLVDLLKEQTHPVSATELAMLYSHKSGGTVKRALSILGCGSNLIDYISSESKQFSINSGMVSLTEPWHI